MEATNSPAFLGGKIANSTAFASLMAENSATIVVEINNSQPIDLLNFTSSLTALAREHEASLREARPSIDIGETRLLVVDVRRGSIIVKLLPVLAPFVSSAEFVNTAVDFVEKLKKGFDLLKQVGGRLPDPSVQRLKKFGNTVQAIASDTDGNMRFLARHKERGILQEIVIQKE